MHELRVHFGRIEILLVYLDIYICTLYNESACLYIDELSSGFKGSSVLSLPDRFL